MKNTEFYLVRSQPAFTCSKSTMETPEQYAFGQVNVNWVYYYMQIDYEDLKATTCILPCFRTENFKNNLIHIS